MFDGKLLDYNADEIEKNMSVDDRKVLFDSFSYIFYSSLTNPQWFGKIDSEKKGKPQSEYRSILSSRSLAVIAAYVSG